MIDRGLARAVKAKRLTKSEAAHYRTILERTRAVLRGLPATRKATLAQVLYLVRLQAGAFTKPRALALFSMLDENARYLKEHALPADGTDVVGSHGVVYRAGWGYGLQFHPLANVAALNGHVAAGRTKQAKALANALIARAVPRGKGSVWEYYFPYGGGAAPWTAGMAQAAGAQALARAGKMTAARRAFAVIPRTLVLRLGAGPWIQHYSFSNMVVLNAQLQTVLSLREYAEKSGNKRAAQLAATASPRPRKRSSPSSTRATGRATRWGANRRSPTTSTSSRCSAGSPGAPASRSGRRRTIASTPTRPSRRS